MTLRADTIILIVALLAGSHFVAYGKGQQHEYAKHTEYRANVAAAQRQAKADADAARAAAARINEDTAAGWAASVDWHRSHPRIVRVLQPARPDCDCRAGAEIAAAGSADAPTGERQPDTPVDAAIDAAQCEAIANAAIGDAAQLLYLQKWIKDVTQ